MSYLITDETGEYDINYTYSKTYNIINNCLPAENDNYDIINIIWNTLTGKNLNELLTDEEIRNCGVLELYNVYDEILKDAIEDEEIDIVKIVLKLGIESETIRKYFYIYGTKSTVEIAKLLYNSVANEIEIDINCVDLGNAVSKNNMDMLIFLSENSNEGILERYLTEDLVQENLEMAKYLAVKFNDEYLFCEIGKNACKY